MVIQRPFLSSFSLFLPTASVEVKKGGEGAVAHARSNKKETTCCMMKAGTAYSEDGGELLVYD